MEYLLSTNPCSVELAFQLPLSYGVLANDPESQDVQQRRFKHGPDRRTTSGNRVLLVGRLRELALYRAEVLSAHGFRVTTPTTTEDAMRGIRRNEFDIAVLTYTLSTDLVEELAEQVRQHCPRCPLIVISDSPRVDQRIFPDETVLADDGPAALIAALRRVIRTE
jgi:Response regulator containing CheY-like receiver, AAA-type ATPase, and DNA-binding domains